ncbi:MAG: mechanosensitive ion channel [Magnetococcales bacterium]|nr:mechanosensitive ion channel [Magnetococcales bacterium]NGZ26653.1 mechanosensitive ion channel [Magnetococcales bacterium]
MKPTTVFLYLVLLFPSLLWGQSLMVWEAEVPTLELVASSTQFVNDELGQIAKEATDTSSDGQRRTLLKLRLEMLRELGEILTRMKGMAVSPSAILAEEKELSKEIARQNALPAPTGPDKPSQEGINELGEKLEKASHELESLTRENKERQEMLQQLPQLLQKAREERKAAQEDVIKFQELSSKADGATRKLLQAQVNNARMRGVVADARIKLFEGEHDYEKRFITVRDSRLEVARLRHHHLEQAFQLYQKAMEKELTAALKNVENTLTVKEKAAAQASSPMDKFVASWEAEVARIQKNIADIKILRNEVTTIIAEQDRQLKTENDELKNLENLARQYGNRVVASGMLQETFRRIGVRRLTLKDSISQEVRERITTLHNRGFAIDAQLFGLRERWRSEMSGVMEQLQEGQKRGFEKKAEALLEIYRHALLEEKRLLIEIDSEQQRLEMLPMERTRVLDDMEAFVFSRVFWVRDAQPLGLEVGQTLFRELFAVENPYSLINWWAIALSTETSSKLSKVFSSVLAMAYGLFFILLLPGLLIHARGRLRRFYEGQREMVANRRLPLIKRLAPVLAAEAGVVLTPVYLVAATFAIDSLSLPAAIGTLIQQVMLHFAFFWFLWLTNRLIFGPPGVAHHLLAMPESLANNLHASIRIVLMAYLVCLLPWMIFRVEPFVFESVPRIGFTLFEVAVALAIHLLIRPTAPLITLAIGSRETAKGNSNFFARHWGAIHVLISLFMVTVIGLDMVGYRFGAMHLASNGLLTLVTIFVMTALHKIAANMLEMILLHRRRIPATAAPGSQVTESRSEVIQQIRTSMRFLFIMAGVLLLANYWGVNQRALDTLNGYTLYSTTAGDKLEVVTLADFFKFVVSLVVTYWLLKHLPRLYELLLFPRMNLDDGLRYALVTISRYFIFLVGFFMALAFLRLDLSKVGWLAAAISVGIGFGLQEIVANFISGIILLIERPIRVGDTITVGTASGKVTRINIRSTTILNQDAQELLIPNRNLITKEVTNWTLGNTHIRLKIPIGVAYGSDVDHVRQTLLDLAYAQPEILLDPAPEAIFLLHGPSSLDFELRVFIPNPTLRTKMLDRLNTLINKTFAAQGIEIPFNQQELRIRSWPFFTPPTEPPAAEEKKG